MTHIYRFMKVAITLYKTHTANELNIATTCSIVTPGTSPVLLALTKKWYFFLVLGPRVESSFTAPLRTLLQV